ncbi:MAG TPA: hypothetical protein VJR24_07900 [Gemmatimonadaceae bacterium]|nr:hypothetical protein [Gemmatimonadaceae bacterium]
MATDGLPDLSPKVVFAHLCDYAGFADRGKPIIVGAFDMLYRVDPTTPITLAQCHFIAKVEASIATGTDHEIDISVRTEDETEVHRIGFGRVQFKPAGPGRPFSALVIVGLTGMPFPSVGDYTFQVIVDGQKAGEAPFYVVEAPAS